MHGEDFDALAAAMGRWAADHRVEQAAGARSRIRWLRQQAAEGATLAGVLLDLAERAAPVTVDTTGRLHQGRVEMVTTGLCALRKSDRGITLIALPAVTAVRGPTMLATGDRIPPVELDMAGALSALAADRSEVTVEVVGGAQTAGALTAVGIELVCLHVDGEEGGTVLVPIEAVTACSF